MRFSVEFNSMYPESKHSDHLSNHLAPTLATIPSFTALSFHTWRVILTPSSRGHYWWRFFIDGFVFRSAHSGSLSNPLSVSNTKQMSQETAWFQPCINYASSCSVFEKRLNKSSSTVTVVDRTSLMSSSHNSFTDRLIYTALKREALSQNGKLLYYWNSKWTIFSNTIVYSYFI